MNQLPIMPFLFLFVVGFLALIWGALLWRFPSLYNPETILYRQVYLWYVVWYRKEADESFALRNDEVAKAGRLIFVISAVGILIIFLFIVLLGQNT
jgi:hypothetical protein